MGREGNSLGSDDISAGKVFYLMFNFAVLVFFGFLYVNAVEASARVAQLYIILGIIGLLAVAFDFIVKRAMGKFDLPDTLTFEKESPIFGDLGRNTKVMIVAGSLAIGGLFFLTFAGQTPLQLVGAPSFQFLEPSAPVSALQSGAAGIIENLFFFGFLMPTIFVVLRFFTKENIPKIVSLILAVILAAGVFTLYHFNVYGGSAAKIDTVFEFGLFCGGTTALTGMLVTCDSIHFWNNFGVSYFRQTSADILLWIALYELVIILFTFAYWTRFTQK